MICSQCTPPLLHAVQEGFFSLRSLGELFHSPLQPEEGAPENVVLFPPQENQNDYAQVQYLCVCVRVYECPMLCSNNHTTTLFSISEKLFINLCQVQWPMPQKYQDAQLHLIEFLHANWTDV